MQHNTQEYLISGQVTHQKISQQVVAGSIEREGGHLVGGKECRVCLHSCIMCSRTPRKDIKKHPALNKVWNAYTRNSIVGCYLYSITKPRTYPIHGVVVYLLFPSPCLVQAASGCIPQVLHFPGRGLHQAPSQHQLRLPSPFLLSPYLGQCWRLHS